MNTVEQPGRIGRKTSSGRTTRRNLVILAAVAGMLFSMLSLASPASASAYGCTLAPGYTGALNCINVVGSGLTVNSSRSEYKPGVSPWPANLCSRTHQWQYKKFGTSSYTTRTQTASSCIPGVLTSYIDWSAPGKMADNSTFCARSKNSHTSGVYSNFACATIKA